jgi:glycosyltransferase involved in cell wall biosynthesis
MKKKILFILHLPPPVHGSSLVGSQILNSKKINESFHARYVNLNTSNDLAEIGRMGAYKVGKYLKIISLVLAELIFRKPDLVYIGITARGTAFYKDAFLVALCKLFGCRMIFHFNNKGVSADKPTKLQKWLYEIVFKNSRAIVLSEVLYGDVEPYFKRNEVAVCPYGVEDVALSDVMTFRSESSVQSNRNTILYLGNLIKSKGSLVLLQACYLLNIKGVDFKCVLVGGEGDISALQLNALIRQYNLEEKVFYSGKLVGEKKAEAFRNADVFAFPTFYSFEALPIVNIEAMHWGLPVVSTFEGGIPDEIVDGETGFLVEQKDANALADKLEILLRDRELRLKMSIAGRQRYEAYYTYQVFEQNILSILHDAINMA